tara:strand:- start:637 stop:1008 length:372 start_codon:yes stop_codon:yes gene_type:complete
METTFADFAATQQARNDIQLKIVEHCLTLCDKLAENFDQCHPKSFMEFELDSSGRKYHKIWQVSGSNGSKSCHAFIEKKTGEVFKPASYKAPAKIVRYRLLEIESREKCFNRADWAGSYLYVR